MLFDVKTRVFLKYLSVLVEAELSQKYHRSYSENRLTYTKRLQNPKRYKKEEKHMDTQSAAYKAITSRAPIDGLYIHAKNSQTYLH